MPAPVEFSDYFSIAAILISAASLYLSYRNYRRDTSRLKILTRFEASAAHGCLYTLTMVNVGRRPVTVTKVLACLKGRQRFPVFDSTTLLAETASREIIIPMTGFGNKHPLTITAFEVQDSSGKVYVSQTWKLRWQINKALRLAR